MKMDDREHPESAAGARGSGEELAPGGSTGEQALIETRALSFSYDADTPVLEDITFSIGRGEFVCVVGPSGCGKSTLLGILSGLIEPTSGSVRVAGTEVYAGGSPTLPPLGFVFQEPRLLPWRTVRDNIVIALRAAEIPKEQHDELVARYLRMLHIEELADAWPLMISGGQRQRVAIARALAVDPLYVLMDEPFSALDELTARKQRAELLRLWQESGKTIVFVTHSVREAASLADRILVLTTNPGRLYETVEVELPRPRALDSPEFLDLEARVLRTVIDEWERANEEPAGAAAGDDEGDDDGEEADDETGDEAGDARGAGRSTTSPTPGSGSS